MFVAIRGNTANSKAAIAATEDRAREIVTAAHPCSGWVGVSTSCVEVVMHLDTGRELRGIITAADDRRPVAYTIDPDGVFAAEEKRITAAWIAESEARRAAIPTRTVEESLALADLEDE